MVEEEFLRIPSSGWAAVIRKLYELDPLIHPLCVGVMSIIAFLRKHAVVAQIRRSRPPADGRGSGAYAYKICNTRPRAG